jgi:hypothetical protein
VVDQGNGPGSLCYAEESAAVIDRGSLMLAASLSCCSDAEAGNPSRRLLEEAIARKQASPAPTAGTGQSVK